MSFNPGAQFNNSLNSDTQSAQVEFSAGDASSSNMSSSSSNKIMENYLILDRLNKKQQRKQQQLKLKQLQAQQQLNELRQRQLEYELAQLSLHQQHHQNDPSSNSKLTSHYVIPTAININNTKYPQTVNTTTIHTQIPTQQSQPTSVSNLRQALQQQLSQQSSAATSSSPLRYQMSLTSDHHPADILMNMNNGNSGQIEQSEPYQFVQVCGFFF